MVKQIYAFFVLVSMLVSGAVDTVFAQSPDSLWARIYGETGYDRGKSMVLTPDEGFAIVGEFGAYYEAGSLRNGDIWLVRTDSGGDTLWSKIYGGPGIDEGFSIRKTSDDGFIIAGAFSNNIGIYDAWLIRTDADGNELWSKTYTHETQFNQDWASYAEETSDGGFIFTGSTSTQTTFSRDVWLVRTDADGDTLWTKTFGGTGTEHANSVRQTEDGGFIVAGETREIGVNPDLWLIRTDEHGDTLWTKRYNSNSSFNDVDRGREIILMHDGGFSVLAQAGVSAWLLRTDMNGDTLWTRQYFGIGNSFQLTSDGGYIIVGGVSIIRTNGTGDMLWTRFVDGFCTAVVQTPDGGFAVTGYVFLSESFDDLWLFRMASEGVTAIDDDNERVPVEFKLSQNYPNPFNPSTTITFSIERTGDVQLVVYNLLGQMVRTLSSGTRSGGTYSIIWDGRDDAGQPVSSGTYIYRLQTDGNVQTRRMLLVK
jgi:hypothetical protein